MRPLYVECLIHAPFDEVWARTQDPAEHQRWDARFTTITYLPGAPGDPQRFRYRTTVLPGLSIDGIGLTVGERRSPNGTATSALRFAGRHRLALIGSGAGYWRYVPVADGIRFVTGYDYTPAWGLPGRVADLVFRPVLGWATAWSFDRLRIWLEAGIDPRTTRRTAIGNAFIRVLGVVAISALVTGLPEPLRAGCVLAAVAVAVKAPRPRSIPSAARCRRRPSGRGTRTRVMAGAPESLSRLDVL